MNYWQSLEKLVNESTVTIDRPKGSRHPRNEDVIYPFDYGYLESTGAIDGSGIDIWIGSKPQPKVEGIITTVDLFKRDAEIKILYGCTDEEIATALKTHNIGTQSAKLIRRTHD